MPTGYVRAIRSRAQRTSQCSTAQPTAQRGGMLRAFFSDQAAAMSSGKQHHKAGTPPPPLLQRVLMACSSLLYLCCSYAGSHFGYPWLGLWFCLVSALSVAADAGSGLLPERAIGRLRVADRLVGSIGLVTSVVINSDSIPHGGLCCLATASSLCWLAAGRAVARAEPHNRRKYLAYHSCWHALALALALAPALAPALALQAGEGSGLFGAKITGGGSGGSVCVVGEAGAKAEASPRRVLARYEQETGVSPYVFEGGQA